MNALVQGFHIIGFPLFSFEVSPPPYISDGMDLLYHLCAIASAGEIRAEVIISHKDAKAYYSLLEMQKIEMERLNTENTKLKGEIKKMSTEKKPVLTNISNSNPKEIKKIKREVKILKKKI